MQTRGFERDDSRNRAAVIIISRVRNSAAFCSAIEAGRSAAYETYDAIKGLPIAEEVGYLRARGGWSQIIRSAIQRAASAEPVDGSEVLGQYRVMDVVSQADIAEIRASVTGSRGLR
jgi:hypothetical protein